jgi:hypothetical protein
MACVKVNHVGVTLSKIKQFDDLRMCSFCGDTVDVSTFGRGLVLTVERDGSVAQQELYAHPVCLGRVLHDRMPFDPEMFFD